MVMACQECGGEGFSNAFVHCVKCLGYAIHRYCLEVLPKTTNEVVHWFCEDCKPRVPNQANLIKDKLIRPRRKLKKKRDIASLVTGTEEGNCNEETAEPDHESVPSVDSGVKVELEKEKSRKRKNVASLVAGTEEDSCHKGIPEPDSECLSTEDFPSKQLKKGKSRKKSYSACRTKDPSEHSQSDATQIKVKLKKKKKKKDVACLIKLQKIQFHSSQQPCEADKRLDLNDQAMLVSDRSSMNMESDKMDNKCTVTETEVHMNTTQEFNKDNIIASQCSQMNEERRIVPFCGENDIEELKLGKEQRLKIDNASERSNEVSQSANFANGVRHDHPGIAQPVIDPIWRGTFNIPHTDYDTFEGLVAHVSSKACYKVCEEASLLPSLLHLEMLPKAAVWPKSFQECEPSDDNIALYFFPADTKQERIYEHLVSDMMEENLAMRSTAKNAELLIFSSKELPRLYWRFQGNYYLWGVFRGKRPDSSPPVNHHVMVPRGSEGCSMQSNSPNDIGNGKRTLRRVKTWDALSPQSPLSNMGVHGMDMDPESETEDKS